MQKFEKNIPYDQYRMIQIQRSDLKWKHDLNIKEFRETVMYVLQYIKDCKIICCMGVRTGNEHLEFNKIDSFKDAIAYGVEINPKVIEFSPNTFCYDFNYLPINWEKKFDLIYSNSIDHSYDVEKTLQEWHRVCKPNGFLLITFSSCGNVSITDPYCFVEEDISAIIDPKLFEVYKTWRNIGQEDSFNCLLKTENK